MIPVAKVLILAASVALAGGAQEVGARWPETAPMVRILAAPEKTRGKRVVLSGVLRVHDERDRGALYMDSGSRDAQVAANGVLLPNLIRLEGLQRLLPRNQSLEGLDGKYVRVVGTVEIIDYPSAFFVELINIEQMMSYPLITPTN